MFNRKKKSGKPSTPEVRPQEYVAVFGEGDDMEVLAADIKDLQIWYERYGTLEDAHMLSQMVRFVNIKTKFNKEVGEPARFTVEQFPLIDIIVQFLLQRSVEIESYKKITVEKMYVYKNNFKKREDTLAIAEEISRRMYEE